MGNLAHGIIFVNRNVAQNVIEYMRNQLFLHEVIEYSELENRVNLDGYYIANNTSRILVTCDYSGVVNKDYADVVIFINKGLAYIEKDKFGPPGQAWPVAYLTMDMLLKT